MANDYIRREDAVKASLEFTVEYLGGAFDEELQKGLKNNLDSLKPANVAKIVRCKNCQYHSYDEVFCCYWCEHEGMVREVKPDFYCGYGEE